MNNPDAQYERIEHLFPKQRGNVVIAHRTFWRALYHIGKTGCPCGCYFADRTKIVSGFGGG